MIQLSYGDINILLDALSRGASRHESLAAALKPGSHFSGKHDRAAAAMRELHARLSRVVLKNPHRPIMMMGAGE
jgi:hypothetical protein